MNTKIGGKLVKVRDGKMHIKVMGTGERTIVYLPGWNEQMPTVESAPLMRKLAEKYTVCTVEYFGYGLSDATDRAHTNENYVEDVREALSMVGLNPPYILMPYSCSGIYSEYYAAKYPYEIEGIIMLDCTSTVEELDIGDDLLDMEALHDALSDLLMTGGNIPAVGSEVWEDFCRAHFAKYFAKYYEEYLAQGHKKEELDAEVQGIINSFAVDIVGMDKVEITSEELEVLFAEYLPLGYTREELKVQAFTRNHSQTLNAQYRMLSENVKEVMAMMNKIADEIPVLVFHAEPENEVHMKAIDGHLEKLGKVKKHVIIEGSDHGTITFYRDVISKEVDEFLS